MKLFSSPSLRKIVHRGSMIKVIIPEYFFIIISCGLLHCGRPLWFINRGEYGKHIRAFITIIERDFFLTNKITVQKKNLLCNIDTCDLCINNKFATNEDNDPSIDLRNSRKYNVKINDKNTTGKYDVINGNLSTLGWVVLKSSKVMVDTYDESLA